jgi:hypothetical protein
VTDEPTPLPTRQCPSADDRRRLRELCERATPGPWDSFVRRNYADHSHGICSEAKFYDVADVVALKGDDRGESAANAAYIAACHPGLVLSLLDALDAAEADRDAAREALCSLRNYVSRALGYVHSETTDEEFGWRVAEVVAELDAARAELSRLREENAALRGDGNGGTSDEQD